MKINFFNNPTVHNRFLKEKEICFKYKITIGKHKIGTKFKKSKTLLTLVTIRLNRMYILLILKYFKDTMSHYLAFPLPIFKGIESLANALIINPYI